MATSRKKAGAKKSAKKTVKKVAAKVRAAAKSVGKAIKKRVARRKPPEVLSTEERSKLLKPRTDFIDVLDRVTREWEAYRDLRVPGLTASKLASLGKKAKRATEKEAALREKMERQLVPLADARRMAHDAAYRALLDTHAAIKLHARLDAGVVERFAFLAELVRNQPPTSEGDEPTPEPLQPVTPA